MTPYQGIRYHLKEQAAAGLQPANKKELDNLRHATQRNIVEWIFGWIKKKYEILQAAPEINLKKQVRLIYALCLLWNFMRQHESVETMFEDYSKADHIRLGQGDNDNISPPPTTSQEDNYMKFRRDRLADKFWSQYQAYLDLQGRRS